jgi:hypothetical protein
LLLQQNDRDPQERNNDLAEMRRTCAYRYAYEDMIATGIDSPLHRPEPSPETE